MENRSHALIAGLFALVLLVVGGVIAVWLNRDSTGTIPYDLVTVDSVQGLTVQADVRYRGLLVGKVTSIGFDPAGDGTMLVRIGVREGTPMTDTLKATVEMKGVTGIAYVDLDDDGRLGEPLPSSPEHVARIRMQPGLTERVMTRASELMDKLTQTGDQLANLIGPANQQALRQTLENSAQVAGQLHQMLRQLEPAVAEAGPMMRELGGAANRAGDAAAAVTQFTQSANAALARLSAPGGMLDDVGQSLAQLRRAAASLAGTVPQLSGMASRVGQAAVSADRTLQSIERAPQSLLFGPVPVRPGPGEPGFAGFGSAAPVR